MTKPILAIFILLWSHSSFSDWFGDDEKNKNCYNWYGEKEECYRRYKEKSETFVGFNFMEFNGSEEESLTGTAGYGLSYMTTTGLNAVRLVFGGSLYYADGAVSIANTRYSGTLYSGEILLGVSLKAYRRSTVRPMLELIALGGFKSLEMSRPPAGVDNKTFGFSYGGKASMGMEFGFWRSVAIRTTIDYYSTRADIAEISAFPITSLGATFGLTFFH